MAEHELFAKHDAKRTFNATVRADSETGAVVAHATYRKMKEEGTLTLNDPLKKYEVSHTTGSGRWTLHPVTESLEQAPPMISAHKPKWFSRTLLITMGIETFEMIATSKIRDHFVVSRLDSAADAQVDGEADEEAHEGKGTKVVSLDKKRFRNPYTITYSDSVPVELPVFCYWMANLYQRRQMEGGAAAGANAGAGAC